MRIFDISQPVHTSTAVWPGDHPFQVDWTLRQDQGDSVNCAAINLSVHTGTHTDGGFHVLADGIRPDAMELSAYVGRALVIDARGRPLDERILDDVDLTAHPRLLFRTRETIDERIFPEDFAAPTPALAKQLVDAGVRLIGSDAPSMDDFASKTLESHKILARGGVATLENLVLSNVRPGSYTLIALPLKLVEADSSPVRAVLIEGTIE